MFQAIVVTSLILVVPIDALKRIQVHTSNPDETLPTALRSDYTPFDYSDLQIEETPQTVQFSKRPNQTKTSECLPRVAFFHVPKSGGRAFLNGVSKILQHKLNISRASAYGISSAHGKWDSYHNFNDPMRSEEGKYPVLVEFHTMQPGAGELHSDLKNIHTKHGEKGCPVITATMLREPMSRSISQVNYDMEAECLPAQTSEHADVWFERFSTRQSRFLFGKDKDCVQCRNFWQKNSVCPDFSDEEMQQTADLLRSMDVVGVSEDMDSFAQEVLKKIGINTIEHLHIPQGGVTKRKPVTEQTMGDKALNILKNLSVKEDELYAVAKKLAHRG